MKFIRTIIATLLLLSLTVATAFSQNTFKQNFDDIATIDFPKQPVVSNLPNGMGLMYKADVAPNAFVVLSFKMKDLIVKDSISLHDLYTGIVAGAANPKNKKELLYNKEIVIQGLHGIEFCYKDSAVEQNIRYIYQRAIYFNNTILIVSGSLPFADKDKYKAQLDTFVKSFTVKQGTITQFN
ncbi:hypothetical protein LJ707_03565 [Mucilaginibacter sp. UR6-1]|uniref:hypothetical protein n=1 Tax=Mucilaginibacter sp. UR6-1 TaxID=1435643 RepID=UPI001E294A2D|nr:hypothetical protein [Mucilaginibacter sp. UR6-1]MCC8407992.1 hypothetical protein [Mucilaginibacter sp. UR6-1]